MGVAKISSKLAKFLFNHIENEINKGNNNSNFYGSIREAINHHDIYCIDLTNEIFEVNTLDEYEIMHRV